MMKYLISLIVIFIAFIIYIRLTEMNSVFHPTKIIRYTPKDVGLTYEDIYLPIHDKLKLNGWLIKADSRTTLLYFHGNGANIGERINKLKMFHSLGLNVFIIDYRGYGKSEGIPTEIGVYKDAQIAYDYLMTRTDIDNNKIVIYGESLGGAIAVDLASKKKASALIVDSSFTNAVDMAKLLYPIIPSFLVGMKFDSFSKIAAVTSPKLFIHSPEDDVVPFKIGEKLFDAAQTPKEFWKVHGTHNDAFNDNPEQFRTGIENFLKKYNLK